jgi:hypothetical protein
LHLWLPPFLNALLSTLDVAPLLPFINFLFLSGEDWGKGDNAGTAAESNADSDDDGLGVEELGRAGRRGLRIERVLKDEAKRCDGDGVVDGIDNDDRDEDVMDNGLWIEWMTE